MLDLANIVSDADDYKQNVGNITRDLANIASDVGGYKQNVGNITRNVAKSVRGDNTSHGQKAKKRAIGSVHPHNSRPTKSHRLDPFRSARIGYGDSIQAVPPELFRFTYSLRPRNEFLGYNTSRSSGTQIIYLLPCQGVST